MLLSLSLKNDGMAGGDVVEANLIFNQCRESGDHGPVSLVLRNQILVLTCFQRQDQQLGTQHVCHYCALRAQPPDDHDAATAHSS